MAEPHECISIMHKRTSLIDPILLGKWLVGRESIWQMNFMTAQKLSRFAGERSVKFSEEYVGRLWSLGLLRADVVTSQRPLRRVGLHFLERNRSGLYLYADARELQPLKKGWGNSAKPSKNVPKGVSPLFHPFRYYVLYHLQRVLELNIVPMQMLLSTGGFARITRWLVSHFKKWSSSTETARMVTSWNDVTALAVATEPFTYEEIFHHIKHPAYISLEIQAGRIAEHESEVLSLYRGLPVEPVEDARQSLCIEAATLDPNRDVQIMLRLAKGDSRLKLKGRLGGAVHLLTMAEMLRRGMERATGTQLREEDEKGFGWVPENMKETRYGSSRLYDGDRKAAREFMREFRLDYRTRLRWYIEGDTEYFALRTVFSEEEGEEVELVNMKARFGRKGQLLRERLRADLRDGVFSFISLDGDRGDYVRAIRRAAERDEICGQVFFQNPDFEFGNFDLEELEEVIWQLIVEDGRAVTRSDLHQSIANARTGRQLKESMARAPLYFNRLLKTARWGEALMRYAVEHSIRANGLRRQIIEAASSARRAGFYDYQFSRADYRVDPNTGEPMKRSEVGGSQ